MIADTSCLSTSPIVLIDENDPILALMGDRRLVFKNGGISAIITASAAERAKLMLFEEMDAKLGAVRNALRNGERINITE